MANNIIDEEELKQVGHGIIEEDFPTPILGPGDEKINNNPLHNASIIISRDRPAGLSSGYGKFSKKQNGDKCTTIDIVVGRFSLNEDNLKKTDKVGNNFQKDASRIYISQKTDIDKNFQIEEAGTIAPSIGKAGIGIKSDNIRIIGRETVKIVARCTEKNSKGQTEQSADENVVGIELITGNITLKEDVQAIVKAENLKKFLDELLFKIEKILAAFHAYVQFQSSFNYSIANHEHSGHFRSDIAGAVNVLQPFDLLESFTKYNNNIISSTFKDIDEIRKSFIPLKTSYLDAKNKDFIGSKYNRTN